MRSKRRHLERANQLRTPEALAKSAQVASEARKSMVEVTRDFQREYPIAPSALEESPPELVAEQAIEAGSLEFRPPPGTMLRPRL